MNAAMIICVVAGALVFAWAFDRFAEFVYNIFSPKSREHTIKDFMDVVEEIGKKQKKY